MGTKKDRNSKDITEAEEIKTRWKELYKKDLHDPDNHNGVVSHSEPEILECELQWVLKSTAGNKCCGSDRIPAKLFKILKDDAIKVFHSIC